MTLLTVADTARLSMIRRLRRSRRFTTLQPKGNTMKTETPSADFHVELIQGGAKAAMRQAGVKTRDLLMVPIDQIKIVAGLNVRIHDEDYEAHIEEIKESIIENGFYQHFPLPGYVGTEGDQTFIYLVGGFTRFEAAKRAIAAGTPIEALPMVLKPPGTSMLDLTIAIDQDNTGAPLRPYERAVLVKRAIGYGADEATIAQKMNISEQYVRDLLYLLGLPHAVQQMVANRQISAGHAIVTARAHGADATRVLQEAQGVSPAGDGTVGRPELLTGLPAPATGTGRVTPRQTRGATSGKAILSKKIILAAIDYAITLPDGIDFLTRWRKGEADAIAELATFVKQPKRRKKVVKAKGTGRRGRPPKVKLVVDNDPDLAADESDPFSVDL